MSLSNGLLFPTLLTLQAPTPQNDQTHSNNSSAVGGGLFECVWYFVGLVFKGLSRSLCYKNSFVGTLCNELVTECLNKLRKGLFRTLQTSKMNFFCKNS